MDPQPYKGFYKATKIGGPLHSATVKITVNKNNKTVQQEQQPKKKKQICTYWDELRHIPNVRIHHRFLQQMPDIYEAKGNKLQGREKEESVSPWQPSL